MLLCCQFSETKAGPSATLKDVARGILDRLVERPELEVQVDTWIALRVTEI